MALIKTNLVGYASICSRHRIHIELTELGHDIEVHKTENLMVNKGHYGH
mgnify:CR=1 FL=1